MQSIDNLFHSFNVVHMSVELRGGQNSTCLDNPTL